MITRHLKERSDAPLKIGSTQEKHEVEKRSEGKGRNPTEILFRKKERRKKKMEEKKNGKNYKEYQKEKKEMRNENWNNRIN